MSTRVELWTSNGYVTSNLTTATSDGETDSDSEDDSTTPCDIQYVVGDVTHPQHSGSGDTIAVHCVGKSASPIVATKSLPIFSRLSLFFVAIVAQLLRILTLQMVCELAGFIKL